jgi:hypothetical protein
MTIFLAEYNRIAIDSMYVLVEIILSIPTHDC